MEELTILIIEDNPVNMKLIRDLLQLGRYGILEASDARTGIRLAQEHNPDLILMDIQLPGMDGLSATRIIKKDPVLKDIPVVALTAHAMHGDDLKIRESGCDGYISKPIDTRSFLKRILQLLQENTEYRKSPHGKNFNHKNRILIIDSDPLNIKLLKARFPNDKYEVISASNTEETLEKALNEFPDLILLDFTITDMDSYDVTGRLKRNPATRDIPIIMITTLDGKCDEEKALMTGVDEFIDKPVNTTELMARINSVLRLKQYQDQLAIHRQSAEFFSAALNRKGPLPGAIDLPSVLLVEDSEKDARLIQSYLEGQPYRIAIARDGDETISLAQREKTDLILLDINLSDMNCFEICRRLKGMYETRNIPIVMITRLQDMENMDLCIEPGVDDYLIKPINFRELRARINILLKKKLYMDTFYSNYEAALNPAIIDPVTGLYNALYFKRFIELEVKRSLRHGYPVGLVMIGVDELDSYNDSYGRLTGDMILRELARVIKSNVREIDLAARYSDDEIAVILPYYNKENALIVVERIRRAFASHSFQDNAPLQPVDINLCMGIAFCMTDASTAEELIRNTGSMLYLAREERKNRVCIYR